MKRGIFKDGQGRRNAGGALSGWPRSVLLAVFLFLLFDFTALALNVWLSYRIETQAVNINLSGRQRMLSQRMVKVLLELEARQGTGQSTAQPLAELRETYHLFDDTLRGFAGGAMTRDGSGRQVYLEPLSGPAAEIVHVASRIWQPYRASVLQLLNRPAESGGVTAAVRLAQANNLQLLVLMNRLTGVLEQETQHEAARIRLFQGVAFLLALFNFGLAVLLYRRRIMRVSRDLDLVDGVINRIASGIVVINDQSLIIRANAGMEALFGYPRSSLLGRNIHDLLRHELGVHQDGHTFDCAVDIGQAQFEGQPVEIYTVVDVTEQRRTENQLSTLAYHDQLTGLPNRLLFDDRLKLEIRHAARRRTKLAVLFVDLDRFKPVNDEHGHHVGDLMLKEVSQRLKGSLRGSDTVSRRGGDEFTLILTDINEPEVCEAVARELCNTLARPFTIDGVTVGISASIGIALYPDHGMTAQELLRRADEAMYCAKKSEPGRILSWSAIPDHC